MVERSFGCDLNVGCLTMRKIAGPYFLQEDDLDG